MIGDVRDLRLPPDSPRFRAYKTSGIAAFHTDSCDVAGALRRCVRPSAAAYPWWRARSRSTTSSCAPGPIFSRCSIGPFYWSMQGQERGGRGAVLSAADLHAARGAFLVPLYPRPDQERAALSPMRRVSRRRKSRRSTRSMRWRPTRIPLPHRLPAGRPAVLQQPRRHACARRVRGSSRARAPAPSPAHVAFGAEQPAALAAFGPHLSRTARRGAVRGGFPPKTPGANRVRDQRGVGKPHERDALGPAHGCVALPVSVLRLGALMR